jgi:hypothetical protein
LGNPIERDHLGDPGVDGRIILRWRFRKWDLVVWTGSSWLRIGTEIYKLRYTELYFCLFFVWVWNLFAHTEGGT